MRVEEVFTPNEVPTFTYVTREEHKLEELLKDAIGMKNTVASISGPSKSGKTVTLNKVIDSDYVITLSGSNIHSVADLWRQIFAWIGEPIVVTRTSETGYEIGIRAKAGGEFGLPLLAKGKAEAEGSGGISHSDGKSQTIPIDPYELIAKEIGESEFLIFIDDFHYIDKAVQTEISRCIKTLSERGVNFCLASVPHRSDDAVRANSELRGRLAAVDFTYWDEEELKRIAYQGFDALNLSIGEDIVRKLAKESAGSPQLMQLLCRNLCQEFQIREKQNDIEKIEADEKDLQQVLERASQFANFSSTLRAMHSGPKIRGSERKQFNFFDDSKGDVYRAILLAIRKDPRALTFSYDDILERVRSVCTGDSPSGSSITSSLSQMEEIADTSGGDTILDWDEDVLTIVEPYFLFYLRCSAKLDRLGEINRL